MLVAVSVTSYLSWAMCLSMLIFDIKQLRTNTVERERFFRK
ncbi:unnamed protein product [Acanthoscelides obtectus]|uniref:Uncharacterized protein n=1 Tax=Acanthoscelides obtectus TaxID=200917 RepID=A0A9P0PAZ4_ACAOB|nr:unnamed protein product [Acanthoscelides obtectus]CAK1654688.1 hypothetical protein AOBTE_LOCUS18771 [Acanthoscelides obtectus]